MYKKVDTSLDFVSREKDTLKFWKENRIFEKAPLKGRVKKHTPFSMVRPPLMASRISDMSLQEA